MLVLLLNLPVLRFLYLLDKSIFNGISIIIGLGSKHPFIQIRIRLGVRDE